MAVIVRSSSARFHLLSLSQRSRYAVKIGPMQKLVILITFSLAHMAFAQKADQYHDGLAFHLSCLDFPFLGISARTRHHDQFPDLELRLIDPLGRTAGHNSRHPRVPHSQYGKTIEIPGRPRNSKAIALQICNARPGRYALIVSGHAKGISQIKLAWDNGQDPGHSHEFWLRSSGDQSCEFKFRFSPNHLSTTLQWLDEDGRPLSPSQAPVCAPVVRV